MRIADGELRFSASDVSNFLACRHLTRLDQLKAHGLLQPDTRFDIGFQQLIERGTAHEERVLDRFRADGLEVVSISEPIDEEAADETRRALADGAQVIYQGVLLRAAANGLPAQYGRPDFLVRAGVIASLGLESDRDGRYEVVDAKLARSAKARSVLQAAFYSRLLSELLGAEPRRLHLALGNSEFWSMRVADVAAYERQVCQSLTTFVAGDPGDAEPLLPYPEPVEQCAICRWRDHCRRRRVDDDDLSLVAGMPTSQRLALKAAGISTRRGFASMESLPDIRRSSPASLARAQLQARLQVASEDEGVIRYELLDPVRTSEGDPSPNIGLLALPEPVVGDLFFDIEGARYYSEDNREFGLQYLFGIVDTAELDASGRPKYTQIWAFDRSQEKGAFEELVDFITERRRRVPGLHVYHYNHYEPTSIEQLTALHETREEAVGRLMGRFDSREEEVDDLFRGRVFVDLYRVIRQGLRVGVEGYSIKRLETLVGYERQVGLAEATEHLIAFEEALDEHRSEQDPVTMTLVAGYNEDDCRATLAVRDWLEVRRGELSQNLGLDLQRPTIAEEAVREEDSELAGVKEALLVGIPQDSAYLTDEQRSKVLLANLLGWHRREAKPAWWNFFRLRDTLTDAERVDERDAIGELTGGDIAGLVKKSIIRQFSFPEQEHGFEPGDKALDPTTGKSWTVQDLDDSAGTISLRIGLESDRHLPTAIIKGGPPGTRDLADRLLDLGARVASGGLAGNDAASALLARRRPAIGFPSSGSLCLSGETPAEALIRIVKALGCSYIPVQGPPGTGKTHAAAIAILELVDAGRPVGITASSHSVIHTLLEKVFEVAGEKGRTIRAGQRADGDNPYLYERAKRVSYPKLLEGLETGEIDLGAGTVWTWARPEFADSLDTLFIDEAGQLSLANVLAVAGAARNLVLLGDPQQLAQPSQAAHPPGAEVSALGQILGDSATMPEEAGLFLDRTYRMHPALCRYTSDVFYEGRLAGMPDLDLQAIEESDRSLPRAGLRVVEVVHEGNTNSSPEEAEAVAELVRALLDATWTNKAGLTAPMAPRHIMVVTPYNAQIREIHRALDAHGLPHVRVGTVDKFQGQEAPAVLYSMATSSAAEAPRGMEFLYDLHRLNVATSRARALAIIVASPDLVRVFCKTPHQMVLANALCRGWEETGS